MQGHTSRRLYLTFTRYRIVKCSVLVLDQTKRVPQFLVYYDNNDEVFNPLTVCFLHSPKKFHGVNNRLSELILKLKLIR